MCWVPSSTQQIVVAHCLSHFSFLSGGAQKSLLLFCTPHSLSLFCCAEIFQQHLVLKSPVEFLGGKIVSCLVTHQSFTWTLENIWNKLCFHTQLCQEVWLDLPDSVDHSRRHLMVTRRFEGGHSCRPGRHQDRAHQGRSLLGGHPRNQPRVR